MNAHLPDKFVAAGTVYSDTPAIDYYFTYAQLFIGTKPLLSYVYGMKADKQFINTLEDNIRAPVVMSKLISDRS